MSTLEFKLPDIGEGVHEGEIVRWIVPVGGEVAEDEPVVEVMTDKATVEIPAPGSGVVSKHLFGEGDVAKVGDVIFVIDGGGASSGGSGASAESAPASAVAEAPADTDSADASRQAEESSQEDEEDKKDSSSGGKSSGGGGTLEFKLPDIGEGVHEGEIVRWIIAEGGEVTEDDPVVEVMTDKATVEIPSPASGVVSKHMLGEGEVAKVGDVIFTIEKSGGSGGSGAAGAGDASLAVAEAPAASPAPAAAAPQAPAASSGGAAPEPANPGRKVLAAPATRRLARELGVDLTALNGSGPRGRVKPEDVRAAATTAAPAAPAPAAAGAGASATASAQAGAGAATTDETTTTAAPPKFPQILGARETEEIPFRGIRRKTAEAMTRSKFTATHFSLVEEVDCTELIEARKLGRAVGNKHGVKVTYMPYIMKAVAIGLQEFPQLNAELDEERQVIVQKKYVNLGVAVDTANGLVVPAVKDVHLKGMLQLAAELGDIAGRARTGKLKPDDFSDSTFSITNAGNIGGVFATPIINFPEVAIMGVHAMRRMPRCVGDEIVAREVMMLSISIDHRLVDGADGARFMVRVKELLENPALMLL